MPGDGRTAGARRPRRGGRRERLRSVLVAAVPSALILGMGVVPGPAAADVLQPPYPFRAGPCAERSDPATTAADEAGEADQAGEAGEAGEGREPPEDPAPPEPDDGDPPDASDAAGGAAGTDQDAEATGGPGAGPTDRAADREADREPEGTASDDRGTPAPSAPDDTAAPDERSGDGPQEPPVAGGDRPAPRDTDRPRLPPDPLGLGEGLRDLTDVIGSILLPGADRGPRADRPAAEPGTGEAAGDPAEDGAGHGADGGGRGAADAGGAAAGETVRGAAPAPEAGEDAADGTAGESGTDRRGAAGGPEDAPGGGDAGPVPGTGGDGSPGEPADGSGTASADAEAEAGREDGAAADGTGTGDKTATDEAATGDTTTDDSGTTGTAGESDSVAAEEAGAAPDEAPGDVPGADDPFAPDAAGRVPYPCPEERDVPGTDEATAQVLPDAPWRLEASHMTLRGLEYHGVVNVRTSGGTVKQALKFTAATVDVGDLHQIVRGAGGLRHHVRAADGSTSTFRDTTVTMYTERLEGNLFGLIPVVFDPRHEPLLDLGEAYFTDVRVTQAGQFGGTLTVPGMRQYMTQDD